MICVSITGREHPKAHRKWFYVVLWFYGEAGNRTCDPWFTRHSTYPLHHGGSFMFLFCLVITMSLCASVYMCFVVTCWERADLLALVCGVCCEFVTFPLVSWVRCGT